MQTHTGLRTDRTQDRSDPADGQDTLLVSCPFCPLRPADKVDNVAFVAFVHTANLHSSELKIIQENYFSVIKIILREVP